MISEKNFIAAEKLAIDVDPDDIPFVALTKQLKGKLWTGDKVLVEGLIKKEFKSVITTQQLSKMFDKLEE